MAWLESHGNLARHPKTRRLMRRLGWTLPTTLGNLHLLWWWALDFAPSGDITRFEPEQLTCDLDLGDATPEEFIEAMVAVGFIDRLSGDSFDSRPDGNTAKSESRLGGKSETLRLHDWPDYTARSLRPRYRRHPERWHQVLTAYNRPIPPRRQRRASFYPLPVQQLPPAKAGEDLHLVASPRRDAPERSAPSCAEREPKSAEYESLGAARIDCIEDAARTGEMSGSERSQRALRAAPNISHTATADRPEPDPAPKSRVEIPHRLAALPGLTTIWWPKFLELYKAQGCPLTAYEQSEVLARLAQKPLQAVAMLKTAVETPGNSSSRLPMPRSAERFANSS